MPPDSGRRIFKLRSMLDLTKNTGFYIMLWCMQVLEQAENHLKYFSFAILNGTI